MAHASRVIIAKIVIAKAANAQAYRVATVLKLIKNH